MRIYKLFFILFYTLQVFASITGEDECQTLDHHQGICKPLAECSFLQELRQRGPSTVDFIEYLRKSHCGFIRNQPKICCPDKAVNLTIQQNNVHLLPNISECGTVPLTNRISLGGEADITQYPWNALLSYNTADGRKEFYCGGALISERYVLTAAHCIKGPNLPKYSELISVRFKEHNLDTNPDCQNVAYKECNDPFLDVPVEETIVHEDYNSSDPNHHHDIALIRLQKKIVSDFFVMPICLFEEVENYPNNTRLFAAGWGIDGNHKENVRKMDHFVLVENNRACEAAFRIKINQNQICTKLESQKRCASDNGGSLMTLSTTINMYATAVKSLGSCNSGHRLVVATRVDRYRNWILSKLKP